MRSLVIGCSLLALAVVLGGPSKLDPTSYGGNRSFAMGTGVSVVSSGPASHPDVDMSAPRGPESSHRSDDEELTRVVRRTCVACHNDALETGNLSLQSYAVETAADQWEITEKMIVKLRLDMMPPPGMPRPGGDTLQLLVETLESAIDEAAGVDPDPGTRRFQRLTRSEYARVIQDLLGLEVHPARWLPPDLGGFDTEAAAQGLSTTSLEAYLQAAEDISRMAIGNPGAAPATRSFQTPPDLSQHAWDHVEGAPYGTRGGMVVVYDFPTDGEYVFSVETILGRGTAFEDMDIAIDGERVALLGLEHGEATEVPRRTEPVFVRAGQRRVSAAFVRKIDGPYDDRFSPHDLSIAAGETQSDWANYGITALPHLQELTISGPYRPQGVSETPSRQKVFSCRPGSPAEERPCARSIITRLATQAYRRPVADQELAALMSFYEEAATEAGFEIGIRTALQAILSSSSFIFRLEREPDGIEPGERYLLGDVDLASRLSFFLWATVPDDELVQVAEEGRLSEPPVLEAQVRRMLDDPRSQALAAHFAAQWLRLQNLEGITPDPSRFPDYGRGLADAMRRETELFVDHLVREDRSFLELFTADYTFVNERLARFYGIPYTGGHEFRRVRIPDPNRRGLLGHGSILTLTSMADRTSPVLRGQWVMEVLLGSPPPPPPPGVPDLEATGSTADGRFLTTRERMEIHRDNPSCNSCHQFIDPIGLALDNFDAVGRWRIRENDRPLDTRGTFYDGSPISTPPELAEVLLKRPEPLVRNFTKNLLGYAIGRQVEHFDQPTVRAIVREAEANDYRMSSFILGVVRSDAFRMKRAETLADERDPEAGHR